MPSVPVKIFRRFSAARDDDAYLNGVRVTDFYCPSP